MAMPVDVPVVSVVSSMKRCLDVLSRPSLGKYSTSYESYRAAASMLLPFLISSLEEKEQRIIKQRSYWWWNQYPGYFGIWRTMPDFSCFNPCIENCILYIKAALINRCVLPNDQTAMCYVKGCAHSEEPTENYHSHCSSTELFFLF